jgi:chromosome segregation ATPase
MKNETTEFHNVRMDGAFVANKRILLNEEANSLRQRIRDLKTHEADLLGQLRQTMEDTADARMKLEHVNSEIARLADDLQRESPARLEPGQAAG